MVEGLARVLERFGYLSDRRPSAKAAYLRGIFDNNALTLAELLLAGHYLEPLEAGPRGRRSPPGSPGTATRKHR